MPHGGQVKELDMWMVEALTQSKGCSSGTVFERETNPNVLLDLLLATSLDFHACISKMNGDDGDPALPTVFIVKGGAPEFFVLPGLTPPMIWYSEAYVGKHLKFRSLIMNEESIRGAGLGHLFDTLSRFYVSLGNENFARSCLFQSLIELPSSYNDSSYYDGANEAVHRFCLGAQSVQAPEAAIVALYFGLAHELGHLHETNAYSQHMHPLSVERSEIKAALLRAGDKVLKSGSAEFLQAPWRNKVDAEERDTRSILNINSLRSEIIADWAGFQVLSRFIEDACSFKARAYNKKAFVSEVIIALFALQLIEQCRHVAKHNLRPVDDEHSDNKKGLYLTYTPSDFLTKDDPLFSQLSGSDRLIDFAAVH